MTHYADDISHLIPGRFAKEQFVWRQCAERVLRLTEELLIASPSPSASRSPVDLNHVIELIAATWSRLLGEKIGLRFSLWPEPVTVLADGRELERVLLNLVFNARDAMPGGGLLAIETAIVTPSSAGESECDRTYALLRVDDTGGGMTTEIKAHIFEPLFTTKDTGTGLGLSSVALTVEQLDGLISVESEPGRGTSVTVMLPLAS